MSDVAHCCGDVNDDSVDDSRWLLWASQWMLPLTAYSRRSDIKYSREHSVGDDNARSDAVDADIDSDAEYSVLDDRHGRAGVDCDDLSRRKAAFIFGVLVICFVFVCDLFVNKINDKVVFEQTEKNYTAKITKEKHAHV